MSDLERVTITMSAGLAEGIFGGAADYVNCSQCGLYMSWDEVKEDDPNPLTRHLLFCGDKCKADYLAPAQPR